VHRYLGPHNPPLNYGAVMTEDPNAHLEPALPDFEVDADEATTLEQMLDYYRAVLQRKASGLSAGQLDTALPVSDLTIGGLINHMAMVEDNWFTQRLQGQPQPEPWASMDWDADWDSELHTANQLSPDELMAQYRVSLDRSRAAYAAAESLDQTTVATKPTGERWNLRWIMVHMIEEYARHCGHADLIRQSIDGVVDD